MRHYIDGNKYYIVGINGETLFSLTLTDEAGNQVVIETPKEVFAGPLKFLSFTESTKDE